MKKFFVTLFITTGLISAAYAQHENHTMPIKDTGMKMMDKDMNMDMQGNMPGMDSVNHGMMNMSHAFSRNLPMSRNGSGTGWLPDASPMYGVMFHSKKWMYMLHGNLFLRYNSQDFTNKGSRGASKFDAPDWVMFMGQRTVGSRGLFRFNTMFSTDAIIANSGYPLLFQTGESYKGKPLIDRQHPHDLFSELSVSYTHMVSKKVDVFAYFGYPGEPTIGPVAFMHRPAALYNPDAPLSHHWSDATHITFGVATLGVRVGNFKLDGSSFTGREPNEDRFNFDKPRFDSWSGRLSYNPSKNWALQVSHAYIKSPEDLHPDENVNRSTASAVYTKPLAKDGWVNISAVYGLNKYKDHAGESAVLLEGSWRKGDGAIYGRYEYVQKSAEELDLNDSQYGQHNLYPVNAVTLGLMHDLFSVSKLRTALGAQITQYTSSQKLYGLYGKNPMAIEVYLRIYPSADEDDENVNRQT